MSYYPHGERPTFGFKDIEIQIINAQVIVRAMREAKVKITPSSIDENYPYLSDIERARILSISKNGVPNNFEDYYSDEHQL